jgi:hypothetical protein
VGHGTLPHCPSPNTPESKKGAKDGRRVELAAQFSIAHLGRAATIRSSAALAN